MKYEQLDQAYRDDFLAQAMYARETEFFHYDFDRANFEKLLEDFPKGNVREDIKKRLADTVQQMDMVERSYNALVARVTDQTAHVAAVARVTARRVAQQHYSN